MKYLVSYTLLLGTYRYLQNFAQYNVVCRPLEWSNQVTHLYKAAVQGVYLQQPSIKVNPCCLMKHFILGCWCQCPPWYITNSLKLTINNDLAVPATSIIIPDRYIYTYQLCLVNAVVSRLFKIFETSKFLRAICYY